MQQLSPVVQVLLRRLEVELEQQARQKEHSSLNPLASRDAADASVYLERVAGVVRRGLVSEGLAEKKCAFVVDLVPVFAVAHIQGGFHVALAFLVPQVDLQTWSETYIAQDNSNQEQRDMSVKDEVPGRPARVEFLCCSTG